MTSAGVKNLVWAGAATLAAGAAGGFAAALSFAAAAAAVSLPQTAMLAFARKSLPQTAFSLWAGKFACTILFLAAGARFLHSGEMFAAGFFVGGAAAGLCFNIVNIARAARAAA